MDTPRLTQRTVKTGTSIYQPRPISATSNDLPGAHLRLDHSSYRHHPSSWRPNTTATDFTYTFVIPTINRHFCCICYLAFVPFIVFGCHYSHALNLIHLRGRRAYRLCNTVIELHIILKEEFQKYFEQSKLDGISVLNTKQKRFWSVEGKWLTGKETDIFKNWIHGWLKRLREEDGTSFEDNG